jgi:hypothetical protein
MHLLQHLSRQGLWDLVNLGINAFGNQGVLDQLRQGSVGNKKSGMFNFLIGIEHLRGPSA